jgi:hypothetical protein
MKKTLFAFFVFLIAATALHAQTETISYTKLSVSPTGIGSFGNVYGVGLTNAQVDSAFNYLGSHGTISGLGVWAATKLNGTSVMLPHFNAPQNAVLPYKTAYVFAGGTVSGGQVRIPDSAISSSAIPQVLSAASGAISIPTNNKSVVLITYDSLGAYTLTAPTATTDDGKILYIVAITHHIRTVTCSTVGFNAKGSSGAIGWPTGGAGVGTSGIDWPVTVVAYQGNWYMLSTLPTGVTVN